MTATKNSARVVPIRHHWWPHVQNAWSKVPAWVKLTSAGIAIAAGAYLCNHHWGLGNPEYLFNASVSKNPDFVRNHIPAFLTNALLHALVNDLWVIAGYALVLLTAAIVFRAL